MAEQDAISVSVLEKGTSKDGRKGFLRFTDKNQELHIFQLKTDQIDELIFLLDELKGEMRKAQQQSGAIETVGLTISKRVKSLEFGLDELSNVAVIRVVFDDGGFRDTAIPLRNISQVIEFLKNARVRLSQHLTKQ